MYRETGMKPLPERQIFIILTNIPVITIIARALHSSLTVDNVPYDRWLCNNTCKYV